MRCPSADYSGTTSPAAVFTNLSPATVARISCRNASISRFTKILVHHQAHLPHRSRSLKMLHQLRLLRRHIQRCQLRQNGNALVQLHHIRRKVSILPASYSTCPLSTLAFLKSPRFTICERKQCPSSSSFSFSGSISFASTYVFLNASVLRDT